MLLARALGYILLGYGTIHLMTSEEKQPTPPEGVIVASNGAWRDATTGQFVKGMPAVDTAITRENAVQFQQYRQDKKLNGMVAANNGAGRLSSSGLPEDTWADIAEKQADLALNGAGYVAVKATETLGRMTGFLASGSGQDRDQVDGIRITGEISASALADAMALVKHVQGKED